MQSSLSVVIKGAVEGVTDAAVFEKLVRHVGAIPGTVYGGKGKDNLRARVKGYNDASRFRPWFVIVDLNDEFPCPGLLRSTWIPNQQTSMCFRVAVREMEAWLMADSVNLAAFLQIPVSLVPQSPEAEPKPKQSVVNLARQSRNGIVRADMVPRPGSGRSQGPAYTARIIEFVRDRWDPNLAAMVAPSLARGIANLAAVTASAAQAAGLI